MGNWTPGASVLQSTSDQFQQNYLFVNKTSKNFLTTTSCKLIKLCKTKKCTTRKNMSTKILFSNFYFFETPTLPHPPTKDSFQVVPVEFRTVTQSSSLVGGCGRVKIIKIMEFTSPDYNTNAPGGFDPVSILFKNVPRPWKSMASTLCLSYTSYIYGLNVATLRTSSGRVREDQDFRSNVIKRP